MEEKETGCFPSDPDYLVRKYESADNSQMFTVGFDMPGILGSAVTLPNISFRFILHFLISDHLSSWEVSARAVWWVSPEV